MNKKLIVQIPCYNEEGNLETTLSALPRRLPGFDAVEWLIIDDGSTDGTVEVARSLGVEHIVRLHNHQGLSAAFRAGLDACLREGADVIVNIDADNQYDARDIPKLLEPLQSGKADLVVGARPVSSIPHFSFVKKFLQRLGSWVVRKVSGTDVPDAPSGFRAMTRDAARKTHVFSEYTYTLETIIQAGQKGFAVASVPVRVNENLRPSRLVRSVPDYIRRQFLTILRIFVTYRPFRFFAILGSVLFGVGFLISLRFVYYYLTVGGGGHIQSLILSSLLMSLGVLLGSIGLLADLISVNRKLLEQLEWRIQNVEERLTGKDDER